jgi:hypothetical protein
MVSAAPLHQATRLGRLDVPEAPRKLGRYLLVEKIGSSVASDLWLGVQRFLRTSSVRCSSGGCRR